MYGYHFIQDLAVILAVAGVVGWIFQRLGLSVILGFVVAGMLVGPHAPSLRLITDPERIDTLAQTGLVFLVFSIGLRLSIRKLRRLGLSLIVATLFSAVTVFYLSRLFAAAVNLSAREGLLLAVVLTISSSAVIGRILQETGTTHERVGQLATGISLLEDVLAVVLLTLLGSLAELGDQQAGDTAERVLLLFAFVVLAGVIGLLFVPWLLRRLSVFIGEELQTIGMAALLFGFAVLAHKAGYSMALGAFLLGTIVAETLHRHQVERVFEGLRDVFSAVFFVAIGLQTNLPEIWAQGGTVLMVAVFALGARSFAVGLGLTLVGTRPVDAVRAGATATPIGEFSFILAQIGIASSLVSRSFFPLVVGVSLATTLAAPLLTRQSEWIASRVLAREPRWLRDWLALYRSWLGRMRERRERNMLWQLSRKRITQVSIGMLFVTGLIALSGKLFSLTEAWLGRNWLFPHDLDLAFWTVLALISLAPLVAIWRNISSMALLFSQVSTRGKAHANRLRPVLETVFKIVAAAMLGFWLVAIAPVGDTARWLLLTSGVVALAVVFFLRRQLIYWHSELEVELLGVIETGNEKMSATAAPWLQPHGEWDLHMVDFTLPDMADCQGKRVSEIDLRSRIGCTIVGVERQGFMIPLPPPETVLYPRDKVLLLGTLEQVRAGRAHLDAVTGGRGADSLIEEVSMESLVVPPGSPAVNRTLAELAPTQTHGVQIAGLHRAGVRTLNPSAQEVIREGDELLVLGAPAHIAEFELSLREG